MNLKTQDFFGKVLPISLKFLVLNLIIRKFEESEGSKRGFVTAVENSTRMCTTGCFDKLFSHSFAPGHPLSTLRFVSHLAPITFIWLQTDFSQLQTLSLPKSQFSYNSVCIELILLTIQFAQNSFCSELSMLRTQFVQNSVCSELSLLRIQFTQIVLCLIRPQFTQN